MVPTRLFGSLSRVALGCLLASCLGYRTPLEDAGSGRDDSRLDGKDAAVERALLPDLPSSPDARTDGAEVSKDAKDARPDDLLPDRPRDLPSINPCLPADQYVLVLGGDYGMFRFDPDGLSLSRLATVRCASNGSSRPTLNSMTVSPIGPAYISNHDGELCKVDTTTFQVDNPVRVSTQPFGMALIPDNSPSKQSLFITVQEYTLIAGEFSNMHSDLSKVDLTTLSPTGIGTVRILPASTALKVEWVELTAGPKNELYGFSVGVDSSLLLTIGKEDAVATDVVKVPAGFKFASFALVDWQGAFYLFLGDASPDAGVNRSCTVYRWAKGDPSVTKLGSLPVDVIGAGVACKR
jgi:hypothetical protein